MPNTACEMRAMNTNSEKQCSSDTVAKTAARGRQTKAPPHTASPAPSLWTMQQLQAPPSCWLSCGCTAAAAGAPAQHQNKRGSKNWWKRAGRTRVEKKNVAFSCAQNHNLIWNFSIPSRTSRFRFEMFGPAVADQGMQPDLQPCSSTTERGRTCRPGCPRFAEPGNARQPAH